MTTTRLESRAGAERGHPQRGEKAEQDGARGGQEHQEEQGAAIQPQTPDQLDTSRRQVGADRFGAPPREHDPEHPTEQRQKQRFGQQLAGQPQPARSDREAHGHLAAPLAVAAELQVGDVHAGDEEHEPDRRHQHGSHDAALARGHGEGVEQHQLPCRLRVGVVAGEPRGEDVELGLCRPVPAG
jgi:hypothetical protein